VRRIDTPRGPVFVRPGRRDRAVVYVHGYRDTAESALSRHGIAAQARTSATLVIPEAPTSAEEPVNFPDLGELLAAVGVPSARAMAIGHSGGFRTLKRWLGDPKLEELMLLDAAYGDVEPFARWAALPGKRLHVVGYSTSAKSRNLAARAGVPYHQGRGHESIVKDEGWIDRFVSGFAPEESIGPLLVAVGGGALLYLLLR